jgi:formate dehydrogenase major subunit
MKQKPGVCTFCGTGCGHFMMIQGGAVERVFPSQNHPVSKGRLCVRGWNIHELLNTPQIISGPLLKQNGQYRQVSYDEALPYVAQKLKSFSPAAIGFLASPRATNEEQFLLMKLARAVFKTNNITLASESGHRNSLNVLAAATGMAGMTGSLEEISKAECVLVLGSDITKQNPIIGSEIHKAAQAGAHIITIDSRRTQMAKLSTQFLHVTPGSLKLAIAAIARCVVREGLINADFLRARSNGFEQCSASLLALTDQQITQGTGIAVESFQKVAETLRQAQTAMAFFASGISGLDEDTIGYIFNLLAMTGHIGREGCGVNPITGLNNLQGGFDMGCAPDLLTGFQPLSNLDAVQKFNQAWGVSLNTAPGRSVYDLLDSAPGSLKALVAVDHDEGIIRSAEAIKQLEFVVYIGSYHNRFMDYAHAVLPVASYIEEDGTFTNTDRRVQLSKKKRAPQPGILPGWKLLTRMAQQVGAPWNYAGPADVMDEIARLTPPYARISHTLLESAFGGIQWPCNEKHPRGTPHFDLAHNGGTINFAPVSGKFDLPAASADFPYLLMIGKAQDFWHQNNLMRKTFIPMREYNATLLDYPDGYIEIAPETARLLQVRNQWQVKVVSPYGELLLAVKISEDIKPNAAYAPYFAKEKIIQRLVGPQELLHKGEDATVPIRIEKV